ncbi:hypothetical protein Syun_002239 [Stephania yunnanensis]|uniref:Uncharacterized protein n=1 Tax=Stephania yunnanensis TaxID=152371 RepID=A0AAP0LJD3_9MAGN
MVPVAGKRVDGWDPVGLLRGRGSAPYLKGAPGLEWLSARNRGHDLESQYLVGMRCALSGAALISLIRDILGFMVCSDYQPPLQGRKSRQATLNRNTEVEGPETGVSKHGSGSVSFVTTNERLIGVVLCSAPEETYELTHATQNQPVDDEAVYYDVAVSPMVPCSKFDNVNEQLQQVVVFMQRSFGMTMDEAGLSQPPPPPLPHEQQKAQTNPADPPQ